MSAGGVGWADEASAMQKEMFSSNPYQTGESLKDFKYGNTEFVAPVQPLDEGIQLQLPVSSHRFQN
jgi:hypothetical protein